MPLIVNVYYLSIVYASSVLPTDNCNECSNSTIEAFQEGKTEGWIT